MPKQQFLYPQADRIRTGHKVMWRYYEIESEAREAAEIAVQDGVYRASLGYDFGYCSPGEVRIMHDGTFEVCCP